MRIILNKSELVLEINNFTAIQHSNLQVFTKESRVKKNAVVGWLDLP